MTGPRIAISLVMACLTLALGAGGRGVAHPSAPVWHLDTGDDIPITVAVPASGPIVVAGSTTAPRDPTEAGDASSYVSMLDAAGHALWTRRDLPGAITAAALDATGAATIIGRARSGPDSADDEAFVVRLDARGATLWERRLTGPPLPADWDLDDRDRHVGVTAVTTDASGNVAIVGSRSLAQGGVLLTQDTFVTLLDAFGATRWTRTLEHAAPDSGWAVAFDAAGDPVVVGGAWGAIAGARGTRTGAYVWKLDATGRTRWVTQFGASIDDTPTGVAVAVDGTIIVVGSGYEVHDTASGFGAFIRAFDGEGTPRWTRPVGHPPWDRARGVTLDAHATALVLVNGEGTCSSGTGATVWGFTAAGGAAGATPLHQVEQAVGHALAQDATGSAIIAGTTRECSGSLHGFVVKIARDGDRVR